MGKQRQELPDLFPQEKPKRQLHWEICKDFASAFFIFAALFVALHLPLIAG